MPRKPRIIEDNAYYHLVARGNNRRYLFQWKNDFEAFLNLVHEAKANHPFRLYHYCIMSNHIHLLVGITRCSNLAPAMQAMLQGYSRYYRKESRYLGHLWQGRYKSILIKNDAQILQCGAYIERNPVRAGMVKTADRYPWSSYAYYGEGRPDRVLDCSPAFEQFGPTDDERRSRYRDFVRLESPMDAVADKILVAA